MSLQEIDRELIEWMREFDSLSNEYRDISLAATKKRDVYDKAKARAMLHAPKDYTVDMKKAIVTETCDKESFECHIAETTRDWYKERLKTLAGLLTAAQSRAKLATEDYRMSNLPRY